MVWISSCIILMTSRHWVLPTPCLPEQHSFMHLALEGLAYSSSSWYTGGTLYLLNCAWYGVGFPHPPGLSSMWQVWAHWCPYWNLALANGFVQGRSWNLLLAPSIMCVNSFLREWGGTFIQWMTNLLSVFWWDDHPIRLNKEFHLDLSWWHELLHSWDGLRFLLSPKWVPLPEILFLQMRLDLRVMVQSLTMNG